MSEKDANPVDPQRLADLPLFADLDEEDRARFAAALEERTVALGAVLSVEADIASRFFIIAQGKVAVTAGDDFLSILGPGDVLGEIGSLRGPRRSANAVAITPTTVYTMMAWDLRELVAGIPELESRLNEIVDRRMGELGG